MNLGSTNLRAVVHAEGSSRHFHRAGTVEDRVHTPRGGRRGFGGGPPEGLGVATRHVTL